MNSEAHSAARRTDGDDSSREESPEFVAAEPVDPATIAQTAPPLAVEDDGWQDMQPAPWRRYFARMFDTGLLGLLIFMPLGTALAFLFPDVFSMLFESDGWLIASVMDVVATYLAALPVIALLIGLTGTTPGKWLAGVRITRRDGRPIGFSNALRREFNVWTRGMAFAIPVITLIPLFLAHNRLVREKATSWDAGEPWVVTHRPDGGLQKSLFVLLLLGILAIQVTIEVFENL